MSMAAELRRAISLQHFSVFIFVIVIEFSLKVGVVGSVNPCPWSRTTVDKQRRPPGAGFFRRKIWLNLDPAASLHGLIGASRAVSALIGSGWVSSAQLSKIAAWNVSLRSSNDGRGIDTSNRTKKRNQVASTRGKTLETLRTRINDGVFPACFVCR